MNTAPSPTQYRNPNLSTDDLGEQEPLVEYMSIPGFMSRFEHRWHMKDIACFGKEVNLSAESMALAYLTVNDRALGVIRVFPVPLLARIYKLLRVQYGWPEAPALPLPSTPRPPAAGDGRDRVAAALQSAYAVAHDGRVREAIGGLLQTLGARVPVVSAP